MILIKVKDIYKPDSGQLVWRNVIFTIRDCMKSDLRLMIKKSFLWSKMLTDLETPCSLKQETSGGEEKETDVLQH